MNVSYTKLLISSQGLVDWEDSVDWEGTFQNFSYECDTDSLDSEMAWEELEASEE